MIDYTMLMDTVQQSITNVMRKTSVDTPHAPSNLSGAKLPPEAREDDTDMLNDIGLAIQREGGINI